MNKKIMIGCILAVLMLLAISLTPAIGTNTTKPIIATAPLGLSEESVNGEQYDAGESIPYIQSENPVPIPNFVSDEFIIKFREDVNICLSSSPNGVLITGIAPIDSLNKDYGVTSAEKIFKDNPVPSLSNVYKFTLREDADILSIVDEYNKDPYVVYAEPNYVYKFFVTPNDPDFHLQWSLDQPSDCDIDAPEAWDIETGDEDVVIAMVDSGVDYDHEDLASNIWVNSGEDLNGNGVVDPEDFNGEDDDGNGFIDDIRGYDFVDINTTEYTQYGFVLCSDEDYTEPDNDPIDVHGHGTHCSGIASAVTDNGVGIAGVCWSCRIMPVRSGFKIKYGGEIYGLLEYDDCAAAIYYAANNSADVISMSWGGYSHSNLISDALNYAYSKEVVLVAAAGNGNTDDMAYPASYEDVIAVAATDHNDEKAGFSNYGDWIDIAAPGVDIYSTLPINSYVEKNGTSMACPHVSGLAGLLLSEDQSLSPEVVRDIIIVTADRLDPIENIGRGRINAHEALLRGPGPATALIDSPTHGADVKDVTDIFGTAWGEGFQYYTVEYGKGRRPSSWVEIANSTDHVQDDIIASLDTTALDEWIYNLRLTVVCNNGVYKDALWMVVNNEVNTIYVDDDGGPGVDYTSIRGGICGAGNGDTVYVYSGTYNENVKVWKTITLTGENKTTTTITTDWWMTDIVQILADGVNISCFSIEAWGYVTADIYISSNNTIICGNYITNHIWLGETFHGIVIGRAGNGLSNNTITGNTIAFTDWGIALLSSSNNNISNNTFTGNMEAIAVKDSTNNIISGNNINSNYYWGVLLKNSANSIISKNNIAGNNGHGIYLSGSSNNIILENKIGENLGFGMWILSSDNNHIYHNNFFNNNYGWYNVYDTGNNKWDNGYSDPFDPQTDGGNYWDDHLGFDFFKGPDQNIPGRDGIVDRPYKIPDGDINPFNNNKDMYPLMGPYPDPIPYNNDQASQSNQRNIHQQSSNPLLLRILERFLELFPLLRQIMGLY